MFGAGTMCDLSLLKSQSILAPVPISIHYLSCTCADLWWMRWDIIEWLATMLKLNLYYGFGEMKRADFGNEYWAFEGELDMIPRWDSIFAINIIL